MLRVEVVAEIDDACKKLLDADGALLPSPSLEEIVQLAAVCKADLRVIKVYAGDELVGLAVCYVEDARILGVQVVAYRLFGYRMHDYNRIYARDKGVLSRLLAELRIDADICGADVVLLDNILPPLADNIFLGSAYARAEELRVFDSSLDEDGWRAIWGKKSVKRHANKVSKLPGYRVESLVGELAPEDVGMIADMHLERWGFESAESAFRDPRRISEYLCYPSNKVLTRVWVGDEIICCHYGMIYGDTLLWHTPLINVKYLDWSPLEVLLSAVTMFCRDSGLTRLDLGLGDENYKSRFANASRIVYSVLIPVSPLGVVLHFIKRHTRPEKIRNALVAARRLIAGLRDRASQVSANVVWFEKKPTAEGAPVGCNNLVVIRDFPSFVDFCRAHQFAVKRFHYQRFRDGCFFSALHENGVVLSYGWGSSQERFRVGETGQTVSGLQRVILFDFYTPPAQRRKGYYTNLLRALAAVLSDERLVIFARDRNYASLKAIEKAGFTRTDL